jgi:16S rRNA (guanine(966)-N(2))-methyltransferase RsmD
MSLRVIAGTAKGRKLKMPPGEGTRPIMDRVKQALFNILGADIHEAAVLDLFAGTGSVGIEALSRGAARAVFVESQAAVLKVLQENLRLTGLADRAQVVRADVFIHLRNEPRAGFDFVHIAPPQYKNQWVEVLQALEARPAWVNPDGVAVAQIDPREYTDLALKNFALIDQRKYGSTLLCFYERRAP